MKEISKLWEELTYPENWSNEEIISKINQLVQWTHQHDKEEEANND